MENTPFPNRDFKKLIFEKNIKIKNKMSYEYNDDEIFAVVTDYPKYAVSNYGKVLNIKKQKLLKPKINKRKYNYIHLVKTSKDGKNLRLSRVILFSFIGVPLDDTYTADHINKNPSDDRLINLRWASLITQRENQNRKAGELNEKHISLDIKKRGLTTWTYYRVRFRKNNIQKRFCTLNEAISFRDEMVRVHNIHIV